MQLELELKICKKSSARGLLSREGTVLRTKTSHASSHLVPYLSTRATTVLLKTSLARSRALYRHTWEKLSAVVPIRSRRDEEDEGKPVYWNRQTLTRKSASRLSSTSGEWMNFRKPFPRLRPTREQVEGCALECTTWNPRKMTRDILSASMRASSRVPNWKLIVLRPEEKARSEWK